MTPTSRRRRHERYEAEARRVLWYRSIGYSPEDTARCGDIPIERVRSVLANADFCATFLRVSAPETGHA